MRRAFVVAAVVALAALVVATPAAAKEPPIIDEIGISGGSLPNELRTPPGSSDITSDSRPNGPMRATPYRLTVYGRFPFEKAVHAMVTYEIYLDEAGRPSIMHQTNPSDWMTLSAPVLKAVETAFADAGVSLVPTRPVTAPQPASPSSFPITLAVVVAALLALGGAAWIRSVRAPARAARA